MKALRNAFAAVIAMAAVTFAGIRNGEIKGAAGVSGGHRGVARGNTGALAAQRAARKHRNKVANRRAHR